MRYLQLFTLAAFIYLFNTHLSAQSTFIYFDHLDTRRGLVNNIVYDLTQDFQGYIWIATQSGLQQFDGKKFLKSINPSKQSGTAVYKLLSDSKRRLWMTTSDGIFLHDSFAKTCSHVPLESNSFNWQTISSFVEDNDGTIWICSRKGGLFFFDEATNRFLSYSAKWPRANFSIESVQITSFPNGYWLNAESKIYFYDKNTRLYSYYTPDTLSSRLPHLKKCNYVHADTNNSLWLTAIDELDKNVFIHSDFDRKKIKKISMPDNLKISGIYNVKNGVLGYGKSLYHFDEEHDRWNNLLSDESGGTMDKFDTIYCVMEDRDGLVWVGTDNGIQLLKSNDQQFRYVNIPGSNISSNAIVQVNDSLLLITSGRNNTRLSLYNKQFKEVTKYKTLMRLINNENVCVTSLFRDNDGIIWGACIGGKILKVDFRNQLYSFKKAAALNDLRIIKIFTDDEGNYWFASESGALVKLSKHDNSFTKTQIKTDASSPEPIKWLEFDETSHSIWLASRSQLFRFSPIKKEKFSYPIPERSVLSKMELWDGDSIIIATNKGIFLLSKKEPVNFHKLKINTGTFDQGIVYMETDRFNNIWAASNGSGLYKIINSNRFVITYSKQDGIFFQTFDHSLSASLSDNRILMETTHGLLVFSPTLISTSSSNPRVQITDFLVNDNSVHLDLISDSTLQLNWSQNSVSFEFSSFSYAFKDNIQYAYMLEGSDDDWIKTIGDSKIHYSNLEPGNYRFRVRSKTPFYDVLSDEDSVTFTITAPFWNTWYFKIGIILAIGLGIYFIYRTRINKYILIANIKNRISRDLHDHIGSSLSSISIMLNVAKSIVDRRQIQSILDKVAQTSHITQENLDDIVWNINPKSSSLTNIINRMEEFVYSIFENQSIRVVFNIDEAVKKINLRLDKRYDLYLIFKELINNAAKYSSASEITILLDKERDSIKLEYKDNGVGFDVSKQTDGNGILNIKSRSKNLNGNLIYESSPSNGTRVVLKFPFR
jgi:ligand-binding sensor domain-containing protein/two-component sensor histidine kinase